MVGKSNRVWPEIGALGLHICLTGQLGADGFPSESSLPTCMIGRLDHMSAAVSPSPLATCFGSLLDNCFLSGLSASSPLSPVLSLLHITATEIFQKPELVSSAYSLQKLPLIFGNLILAFEAVHDLANSSHLLSLPALPT